MVKRTKRLEKGIESLKEEIGRSLILALERKISLLGKILNTQSY
jgi:hypothetical protein